MRSCWPARRWRRVPGSPNRSWVRTPWSARAPRSPTPCWPKDRRSVRASPRPALAWTPAPSWTPDPSDRDEPLGGFAPIGGPLVEVEPVAVHEVEGHREAGPSAVSNVVPRHQGHPLLVGQPSGGTLPRIVVRGHDHLGPFVASLEEGPDPSELWHRGRHRVVPHDGRGVLERMDRLGDRWGRTVDPRA